MLDKKGKNLWRLSLFIILAAPIEAQSWADWSMPPLVFKTSLANLMLGGSAYGTLSTAFQPSATGLNKTAPGGAATLDTLLERSLGKETDLALVSSFYLYHDALNADNYDSDFVQKAYVRLQTAYGTMEIGMADGAAFAMALTGPVVNDETSMESHNATFFRDPATGGVLIDRFALNSAVEVSFNYAKIAYYTPQIYGVQLGASYAPSQGKAFLPFANAGPPTPDRQKNLWEFAATWNGDIGPLRIGLSGGIGTAQIDEKLATGAAPDLFDWAIGGEIAYPITAGTTLSFGGAYHKSNAYGFDIDRSRHGGDTNSSHLSTKLEFDGWAFGLEYSDGSAKGGIDDPAIDLNGYAAAIGYRINANLSAAIGWQKLRYRDDTDVFYTGKPQISAHATFLHLRLDV
jgi:hypothetical protein